ncbi:mechanosensitive ion channel family protein [Psychrobacter sp. Urea-trap-16]|nr:mechanosensitive ion channel family protein [Psychrobacter sp. Urea-trap-18]MBA6285853.1 mechanosensitive ion channel family protein [Psychrobacter sp. Urea-trap-16]MBA6317569.1 mechanosensitive ion channel family protein [Psychrobacter sp. Urea-trap-20]MBA6333294.1 mechanosensitive ion channel family protein [Psychrobacter sp. Urea-trap-19]PKG59478.1 mechanosensitive ion channel protein MscS [Psychrobacter sp. Choline-3u-12]|tara:strand:+ start:218 stop:1414 length:1197 start_codon:yes stop_codon:yes gene_type:complete
MDEKMPIASVTDFFQEIIRDLHTSLYLALGGSIDEESLNWSSQAVELASTGIKILILLAVLGFFYWLANYILRQSRAKIRLNERRTKIVRSVLRYVWIVASLIAIMSQINFEPETIKATAKASTWAGIYYVLWASSGQIIHRVLQHYGLNASIEQLLKNILSVLLLVLGLASVMAQFGFDIVSLVAGLGIVGLAVGFAAQSTLANFIAGITILLEQSFQVGDWIHINDNEGRVVLIALRTTHILTRDNITVIIPNSNVASSEVINLTSKNFIRFDIRVRIAFEDDIETARKEILQVLSNTDAVLNRPETSATVAEIGEYGVFFIVRFWVKPAAVARIPKIKEVLQEEIKVAFDAANISTPYPHMRLLMPKDVDYPIATKPFATTTQIVPEELPLTKGE